MIRIAAILLVIALSGCGGEDATSSDASETPASQPQMKLVVDNQDRSSGHAAQLNGYLGAETVGDVRCTFITADSDGSASKTYLLWPHGYSASSDGLQVLDKDAKPIAEVGKQVKLGGSQLPTRPSQAPAGCGEETAKWWGVY